MANVNEYEHSMSINPVDGKPMPNVGLGGKNAVGFERVVVGVSAVGFASIPPNATSAMITAEGAASRYKVDGGSPTTTDGHLLGDILKIDTPGQLTNFKVIKAVTGTATLQVTYF